MISPISHRIGNWLAAVSIVLVPCLSLADATISNTNLPAATAATAAPATASDSDFDAKIAKAKPLPTANSFAIAEEKIPVLTDHKHKQQMPSNPWGRLVLSLAIIGLVGGGMIVFSRWYSKSSKKGGDPNKIKILTQYHIGPKKTLAIVRVAGEAILIGITDHNISMLKSLALLDGELTETEAASGPFEQSLSQATPKAAGRVESFGGQHFDDGELAVNHIKDRISLKLKDLRPL